VEGGERERERGGNNAVDTFFEKISNSFDKDIPGTIIFIAFKLNKVSF